MLALLVNEVDATATSTSVPDAVETLVCTEELERGHPARQTARAIRYFMALMLPVNAGSGELRFAVG
jgi:hypothetical protein